MLTLNSVKCAVYRITSILKKKSIILLIKSMWTSSFMRLFWFVQINDTKENNNDNFSPIPYHWWKLCQKTMLFFFRVNIRDEFLRYNEKRKNNSRLRWFIIPIVGYLRLLKEENPLIPMIFRYFVLAIYRPKHFKDMLSCKLLY